MNPIATNHMVTMTLVDPAEVGGGVRGQEVEVKVIHLIPGMTH
jgi:hypothetical protein